MFSLVGFFTCQPLMMMLFCLEFYSSSSTLSCSWSIVTSFSWSLSSSTFTLEISYLLAAFIAAIICPKIVSSRKALLTFWVKFASLWVDILVVIFYMLSLVAGSFISNVTLANELLLESSEILSSRDLLSSFPDSPLFFLFAFIFVLIYVYPLIANSCSCLILPTHGFVVIAVIWLLLFLSLAMSGNVCFKFFKYLGCIWYECFICVWSM